MGDSFSHGVENNNLSFILSALFVFKNIIYHSVEISTPKSYFLWKMRSSYPISGMPHRVSHISQFL